MSRMEAMHRVDDRSPDAPTVSLARLRADGVELEWFEALAITVALCRSVVETPDPFNLLSSSTVFIASDGDVISIVGAHSPGELIVRIGRVFGELLPNFHRTVTFDQVLVGTQATPCAYRTVSELAVDLAAFERPERTAIIRNLYRRWESRISAGVVLSQTTESTKEPEKNGRNAIRRIPAKLVTATLITAIMASLLVAVLLRSRWRSGTSSSSNVVQPGLATTTSTQSPVGGALLSETAAPGPLRAEHRTNRTRQMAIPPAPESPSSDLGFPQAVGGTEQQVEAPDQGVPANEPGSSSANAIDDEDRTYTAGDSDVQPPSLATAQQVWTVPRSLESSRVVPVEVIVNEEGFVERAWSTTTPHSIAESAALSSSLSAIKTWRFKPALRDGHPVRFKHTLSVALR
jgi:hypothetical protein